MNAIFAPAYWPSASLEVIILYFFVFKDIALIRVTRQPASLVKNTRTRYP